MECLGSLGEPGSVMASKKCFSFNATNLSRYLKQIDEGTGFSRGLKRLSPAEVSGCLRWNSSDLPLDGDIFNT